MELHIVIAHFCHNLLARHVRLSRELHRDGECLDHAHPRSGTRVACSRRAAKDLVHLGESLPRFRSELAIVFKVSLYVNEVFLFSLANGYGCSEERAQDARRFFNGGDGGDGDGGATRSEIKLRPSASSIRNRPTKYGLLGLR